jgi:hypothetical protein
MTRSARPLPALLLDRGTARVAAWMLIVHGVCALGAAFWRHALLCVLGAALLLVPTMMHLVRTFCRHLRRGRTRPHLAGQPYRVPAPASDLGCSAPQLPRARISWFTRLHQFALGASSVFAALHLQVLWTRLVRYGTGAPGAPCANPSVAAWEDAFNIGWMVLIVGAVLAALGVRRTSGWPPLDRFVGATSVLFICSVAAQTCLQLGIVKPYEVAAFLRAHP